jgi:hypothetical protein
VCERFWRVYQIQNGGRCHGNQAFSIQRSRSCYATLHLCKRPFYKFVQPIPIFLAYLVPLDMDVVPIKFHQFLFVPTMFHEV